MKRIVLAAAIAFLPSVGWAQTIDWEVINRFRVFDGEKLHNTFIGRIQRLAKLGSDGPLIESRVRNNDQRLGLEHNYSTKWDEAAEQYDLNWVHRKSRDIRVSTSGIPRKARCIWKQDGKELPDRYCSDREIKVSIGRSSKVTVDISLPGRTFKPLETTIEPKDIFIAMIGDSYGSGESNPHLTVVKSGPPNVNPYPAVWWDTRCHRSMASGPVQASALLAERNPKVSVTFVSYACSGAEINDGVRTKYEGRETVAQIKGLWETTAVLPPPASYKALRTLDDQEKPNTKQLEPQIDRLVETFCPPKGDGQPSATCADTARRRPDVLLISIGGNDTGFGEIGRQLLLSNPKAKTEAELEKWRNENMKKLDPAFDGLKKDFRDLADDVRTKVNPARTVLIEYFDPSQYSVARDRHQFCGSKRPNTNRYMQGGSEYLKVVTPKDPTGISFHKNNSLYNLMLTQDETKFAQMFVTRLNGTINEASKLDWNGARGDDAKADVVKLQNLSQNGIRRGVCAQGSWLTGIWESYNRQDWIPKDPEHEYALHLKNETCSGTVKSDGKCYVPAGNITSGVLHPNFLGHYNFARHILLKVEEVLKP